MIGILRWRECGGGLGEAGVEREVHANEGEVFEKGPSERTRRIPHGPSAEEIRLHRITHCPYRSWCPKCVAGRAKGAITIAQANITSMKPRR